MNQMSTYIMIMTGLMLLFYIMGLASNPALDILLAPQSMNQSAFYLTIFAALTAVSGLVLGLVYKNAELATMSLIILPVAASLWTFTSVVSKVYSESPVLGLLVFSPLMFLFGMTLVEYWRGRD